MLSSASNFAFTLAFVAAVALLVAALVVLARDKRIENRLIWFLVVIFIPILGPVVFFLSLAPGKGSRGGL